ncbi:hypothetical protein [Rossellomorea marisflavi]|uniref:hypothetical protein n=1 Tax=Rossellomorea marisflavi TaxID=189381 RepID=UPI003518CA7E
MKKYFGILFLAIILVLSACGKEEESSKHDVKQLENNKSETKVRTTKENKESKTEKVEAKEVETIDPSTNLYTAYYTDLHFGEPIDTLVDLYGEPLEKRPDDQITAMEYSDAVYYVDKETGVFLVTIKESKAAQIVKDFTAVEAMYFPDDVLADYMEERDHYNAQYRLQLTSYHVQHTFYSENEDGNPINEIVIEKNDMF